MTRRYTGTRLPNGVDARMEPGRGGRPKPPRSARWFVRWREGRVRGGPLHDEHRAKYRRRVHDRDRQRMTVEHGEQDTECRAAFDVASVDRRLLRRSVIAMPAPSRAVGATTLVADAVVTAATVRHRVASGRAREPEARRRRDNKDGQYHDGATQQHDLVTVVSPSPTRNRRRPDRSSQHETCNRCACKASRAMVAYATTPPMRVAAIAARSSRARGGDRGASPRSRGCTRLAPSGRRSAA